VQALKPMPRLAIGLEYDGTDFCGWQRQEHAHSIQAAVEAAISRVADEPVIVSAAGRTDAGVHAAGQVAHFDTHAERSPRSWVLGANSNLPPSISVTWAQAVPDRFDARYSAVARTYHYLILNQPARSALHHHRAWWLFGKLDVEAMQAGASLLLGEHDFSAFRAAQCQARTPVRELRRLDVRRAGSFVVIECSANAFLHHMVRNIVGSLVRIGRGEVGPEWLRSVLESRDRRAAGMTAAAQGLFLTCVHYAQDFAIPVARPYWPCDL
jgi:tRNA pseudouridine38-40 synthase